MASEEDFDIAFGLVVGAEGVFSNDRNDPGNWTGGGVGKGELKGTKYGVSAASYPNLDIVNLTLPEAAAIYKRDYWRPTQCTQLPPRLAYVVFDCAVNNGVSRALRFLQTAVGTTIDGIWGPNSQAMLERKLKDEPDGTAIASEVHARRIHFMACLSTWPTFGLGWSRRLASVAIQAPLYWPNPAVQV